MTNSNGMPSVLSDLVAAVTKLVTRIDDPFGGFDATWVHDPEDAVDEEGWWEVHLAPMPNVRRSKRVIPSFSVNLWGLFALFDTVNTIIFFANDPVHPHEHLSGTNVEIVGKYHGMELSLAIHDSSFTDAAPAFRLRGTVTMKPVRLRDDATER